MCGEKPCESPTCTWNESHRAACEAKWLLTLPKPDRLDYLALVAKHRGPAAAGSLRDAAMIVWGQSRSARLGGSGVVTHQRC